VSLVLWCGCAVYPNCLLFANAEYPFPAVGSVHVSNHTKIFRPMPVNEAFTGLIKVRLDLYLYL
jgi:hypothetical protein